jgi:hypothetical protein
MMKDVNGKPITVGVKVIDFDAPGTIALQKALGLPTVKDVGKNFVKLSNGKIIYDNEAPGYALQLSLQ